MATVSLRDGESLADYAIRVTDERDEARAEAAQHLERANQEIAARQQAQVAYSQSEALRLTLVDARDEALNQNGFLVDNLFKLEQESFQLRVRAIVAERERDEARALLREVEWRGHGGCCPLCGMSPTERHAPDCRLKAALEE